MAAFIIAAFILAAALCTAALIMFDARMSDSPPAADDVKWLAGRVAFGGIVLAAMVAGTHWLPHIAW